MLEIRKISKTYVTGDLKQVALNNVSLNFRNSEFVSILGPSGSGKTTLLNIIGGLDHYDSGDLIINSISTKEYKSKDWDSYRNHSVGFVFQSYNLIPHQTILANVELALTISGVSKKERRKRALAALQEVGLKKQAHKRPNQLSGGQMQRVAVARALVNDPDILLADEPTGALDSETSLQVMDLLLKIAKNRLVVMVTHNPELAEKYSTRIVKLKDGKIVDDSHPYRIPKKTEVEPYRNLGKSSMSLLTAFGLSLNNLLTKKGRTILTAFAGSIGIIGIALILSLSNGFQKYIDKVQEDTLTSYPLTIESETADTAGMILSTVSPQDEESKKDKGVVTEVKNLEGMFASIGKNDIRSFKEYIENHSKKVQSLTSRIRYEYSVVPNIYTVNVNQEITKINPSRIMNTLMGGMAGSSTSMGFSMSVFNEIGDSDSLKDNYTVLEGRLPKNYDEVVVILPDENHISDLLLYSLGLKDSSNMDSMISKIMNGEKIESSEEALTYRYEDLMGLEFKLIYAADTYRYNSSYGVYEDMSEDKEFMRQLYQDALSLKVVGVIKPKDAEGMSSLLSGVGYTEKLTKHVMEVSSQKEIVQKQLSDKNINVFSGKRFDDTSNQSGIDFQDLITIDTNLLSSAFQIHIDDQYIGNLTADYMQEINAAITADTSHARKLFHDNFTSIGKGLFLDYIEEHPALEMEGTSVIRLEDVPGIIQSYFEKEEVRYLLQDMENQYTIPADAYQTVYSQVIESYLKTYILMLSPDVEEHTALISADAVDTLVSSMIDNDAVRSMEEEFGKNMTEANMKKTVLTKVSQLMGEMAGVMSDAFHVDQDKISSAFHFNLSEEDIRRIFTASTSASVMTDANTNLLSLGYQDFDDPSRIYFYFKDFASKEEFIDFLEDYNGQMEKKDEEKVIEYTDLTGIIISSVKVIVDSVSYVLIAFVSISLIVSSIMIGIITYISVLERTKEIGILRAIGASKRNISSIFNAETTIIGFLAGVLGVVVSSLFLIPINTVIHLVTNNPNITAVLPFSAAIVLVILSTILTLFGGLIPSRKAAKQDPVLALRSE